MRLLRGAFLCCGAIRLRGDVGSRRQREGRVALKLAFIVILLAADMLYYLLTSEFSPLGFEVGDAPPSRMLTYADVC